MVDPYYDDGPFVLSRDEFDALASWLDEPPVFLERFAEALRRAKDS